MQIQSILQAMPASGVVPETQTKSGAASFTDILSNALQEARQTEAVNDENTLNLLSGDITDIHTATTQAKKAELSLNLAIQIRNKVIDAYNEVMRMQV
ncbi:MAG: flagellar hook-basal body complex protein FliE [Bacillota bacterium]